MASTPVASVRKDRLPLPIGQRELVFMLALTQALQALAVDSMLPGLADIARDLAVTDPNRRQLIVGLYLFGVGFGSLIPGMLADRYGRKKVLLVCIAAYVVICAACALVNDFTVLAGLRFLQGVLCAGLAVVPPAVIRDRFDGDRMASLQSLIAVIFLVVPMLAPSLGQLILLFAGWRWIFGLMALLGAGMFAWLALRLPETLHPEYRQPISVSSITHNLRAATTTRASIGYVLAGAATMAVMWGYVQSCQQLLGEHFGVGRAFPIFFGGMAMCIAGANFTNSRIVERFGARRVGHTALLAYIVFAVGQWILAHGPHETLWQFVPLMTLTMICGGFTGANFSSIALQPFARMAGAASSVQMFIRNVLAGGIAAMIGQAYDGTARPLSTAMVLAGVIALSLVLWSERGRLFRRLYPAGTPRPEA
ncbi:multidrug effflux MFS transporter [Novosphingobium flavum]|uniref:Bcr/CflA family efflux transporter n=1 Tax=Novosphingobium flavum TaxID=1778672 RepID=A0A7X1FS13_9SPHN|nr:multidrug effflux MFS transporter [Novosphingobium flavum]MBC2665915.1 multidrug effflux MFS transporter [Novosphingobium flavum]